MTPDIEESGSEKKSNVTLKTVRRCRAQLEQRVAEALEKFVRDTGLAVEKLDVSTDLTGDAITVKASVNLDAAL